MSTPTQRSLKHLRDQGYKAEVVERWIPGANIRKDLFGCIDIVAIHPERKETLGVQTTSTGNLSARKKKAQETEDLQAWLDSGNTFILHGWSKKGKPQRWTLTERFLDES